MTRSCPICASTESTEIFCTTFTDGIQSLVECDDCGFVYAKQSPAVNYAKDSKYSIPASSGSGESKQERERLDGTVNIISEFLPDAGARILDIGCARGGLLEAFKRAGFTLPCGVDPSMACVDACREKKLIVCQDTIDTIAGKWDCIILSHVLEHLWDVQKALRVIRDALAPNGILYVETPNAMLHDARVPFLEINREHINHFSLSHLLKAVEWSGLDVESAHSRRFERFGVQYPAIYVIGRKQSASLGVTITDYILASANTLVYLDTQLQKRISPGDDIILYGNGEFAQTLMRTKAIRGANIVQILDRDPSKGEPVERCLPLLPIVVASMVNESSILSDLLAAGVTNPVITLGEGE